MEHGGIKLYRNSLEMSFLSLDLGENLFNSLADLVKWLLSDLLCIIIKITKREVSADNPNSGFTIRLIAI